MSDKILAFYIRLSIEDGDIKTSNDKSESNSVTNQRKLLQDYYRNHTDLQGYDVVEFCDDGYSGTNFIRPNFMRMMELMRLGEIQCIIVKDLSRFGREYLEVGSYLELILPLYRTRFISVNEGFDSNNYIGTTGGLELALQNLINGMYSQDLSIKVRSAIKTRNKRGSYWGGQAFFGYQLNPYDKHKLIVDENVKETISLIFHLCLSGKSTMQIAKHLNALGVPSPAAYKQKNGMFYNGRVIGDELLWIGSTVRKILNDERYTGKMISGTRESIGIRTNKMRPLPREAWCVVDGTHEPIISADVFAAAQEALHSRIRTINQNTAGDRSHNLFVCGYCGRKLQKSHGKQVHLFCMKSRSQENTDCFRIHEDIDLLQKKALETIKVLARLLIDRAQLEKKDGGTQIALIQKSITTADMKLHNITATKGVLYEKYRAGAMSKEVYMQRQQENVDDCRALENTIAELKEKLKERKQINATLLNASEDAEKIGLLDEYRPDIVCKLVEAIRVYEGGRIELIMRSGDDMQLYLKELGAVSLHKGTRSNEYTSLGLII